MPKKIRSQSWLLVLWGPLLAVCVHGAELRAEPLRLDDPTPRWIEVSFEISSREHPGKLDALYGPPVRAWAEPLAGPAGAEKLRILIPGASVERFLLNEDRPVPGSFSDYEWVIDTHTGEVEAARLTGAVWRDIDLGIMSAKVRADLDIALSTQGTAGFREARRFFGLTIHGFCSDDATAECTLVQPRAFDPESGYVNAVGPIEVRSKIVSVRTFSPLGEAVFRETPTTSDPTIAHK